MIDIASVHNQGLLGLMPQLMVFPFILCSRDIFAIKLCDSDTVKVGELVLADILCPGCNCQLVVALIGLAAYSGTISDCWGDFWFSVKIITSEK